MAGDNQKQQIMVNGSTSGYQPSIQDEINIALLQSGGIKRIQKCLQQRLDETGWSQNLREYVERLFRSGDATTYEDALKIVMQHIELQPPDTDDSENHGHKVNGDTGAPDLTIPRDAAKGAADTVKKELAKVVKMEK